MYMIYCITMYSNSNSPEHTIYNKQYLIVSYRQRSTGRSSDDYC